jgi:hypothetical protein
VGNIQAVAVDYNLQEDIAAVGGGQLFVVEAVSSYTESSL